MSWSDSRVFQQFVADVVSQTALFDLSGTGVNTFKTSMFTDSITPDRTVSAANSASNVGQWATAQEIWQTGQWAQFGVALASPAITLPGGGVVMFDGVDTASGTGFSTLVNNGSLGSAYGCMTYDDTLTTPVADQGVCFNYLGGPNQVSSGQLTIVWHANGLFRFTA